MGFHQKTRPYALTAAVAAPLLLATLVAANTAIPAEIAQRYTVIQRSLLENRPSLLASIAAAEVQFVDVGGASRPLATVEADAQRFAAAGGRITKAAVVVKSVVDSPAGNQQTVCAVSDVRGSAARGQHAVPFSEDDLDLDQWQHRAGKWLLARSAALRSVATQGGAQAVASPTTALPPAIAARYLTIDRAFRESRYDLVKPFAMAGAKLIEIDGSTKTFDQMDEAGRAFLKSGAILASAHISARRLSLAGDRAIVYAVVTASGSFRDGPGRTGFGQVANEDDTWLRSGGQWLFAEGRVVNQTITTYAPHAPRQPAPCSAPSA